jgi:4-amino-4-deoxy-L-arabinose transferase-like glycosyltransferase
MKSLSRQLKQKFEARPQTLDILLLFCLAFFLRAIYAYRNLWIASDSLEYLTLAKNLTFHHVFSFGSNPSELIPTAFRPPLYPALISLFWWSEEPPLTIVLFLQAFLGALTVMLVYKLAVRHFNRRVAVIAAIALSIEPFTINYTATVMTETLFTFLVVLAAYFWDYKRYVIGGFIFGLCALVRPTVVPFLILLPLLSIFSVWSSYRKAFLTIVLVAAATVSIWTVRNALVFNQIILVSSFGFGMNLLCGTMEVPMLADEGWNIVKADPAIQQMYLDLKNGKPETEVDRRVFREGLQRIVSHPVSWLKARAKQYPRLFIDSAPYILGRNNMRLEDALREGKWFFIIYKLAFASRFFIAVGLALIGIFLLRERLAELGSIVLFPLFLMLIHLPLWTENRYLLPMLPFMFILAAFTLNRFLMKLPLFQNVEGKTA